MTNVQLENGYAKIATELLDAFCQFRIRGESWQVLWVILRKTYGYNKKEDWVANSQIIKMTGLKKQNVWRELSELITHKIVIKSDDKLRLNKNYNEWIGFKKSSKVITTKSSSKVITPVINIDTKVIKIDGHNIQYTKDNTTKEILVRTNTGFGNPDINEISSYFLQVMQLPKEDCSELKSRRYWSSLLKENGRGVDGVKKLIDLAGQDEWYKNNITSSMDLYYKRIKIVARKRGNIPKVAIMPKEII